MKIQLTSRALKTMSLLMVLFIALYGNAQNYFVSFTGHGASTEVTSVLVQNITQGTTETVPAGQALILVGASSINNIKASNNGEIRCFNDGQGNSYVSFNVNQSGSTMINAYSLDGRKITGITNHLSEGDYRYRMSLPKGVAVIQVVGNGFNYTAKLLNPYSGSNGVQIVSEGVEKRSSSLASRVKATNVPMEYAEGDRIIFRGESGNLSTIVSDVITADKTIDFNFVACEDANGNHYSTITIGNQVWMAENLKATKYADGTDIATPRYFNNDPSTLDIGAGIAYNYQSIKDKNIAPEGWRVPDHFEWRVFKDNIDQISDEDSFNAIRKTGPYWGTPGATNASGFSALGTGILWEAAVDNFGTWALWLASDLWNNDPGNSWFFKVTAGTLEELASDSHAMFGAIRCVRDLENPIDPDDPNNPDDPDEPAFNYLVSFTGNGGTVESVLVENATKGTSTTLLAGQVLDLTNSPTENNANVEFGYATGDRLIFRGESGNMSTIVADVITADKTINFDFYPCEDANGNYYSTVTIGTQVWMAENLKATKYADGEDIILITSQEEYNSYPLELRRTYHYCRYFQDNAATMDIGGLAYKYQTIKHKEISPAGWRIPSSAEWIVLKDNISLDETQRINSIRKAGTGGYWDIAGANNASGFSAIATGGFWGEWPINAGQWAIWLANDLFQIEEPAESGNFVDDPGNCYFFYVGKHANAAINANVCAELPSDLYEMVGAIRCLKND